MIATEFVVRNAKIRLVQGDITDVDADAIVNAATQLSWAEEASTAPYTEKADPQYSRSVNV